MLKTKEEIEQWLEIYAHPEIAIFDDKMDVRIAMEKWTINEDLSIDSDGDVNIYTSFQNGELPFRFRHVNGSFKCSGCELDTLEGAPISVKGFFDCSNNNLISLEGAPKEVGNSYFCSDNQLTNLEGAPKEIGGNFDCSENQLTTLEGAPEQVESNFYCSNNKLTTLEGAPKEVGGKFYCSHNNLISLGNIDTMIGSKFSGPPLPEFGFTDVHINRSMVIDADDFNKKVSELKRIREEKKLFEASVSKVFDLADLGPVKEAIAQQRSAQGLQAVPTNKLSEQSQGQSPSIEPIKKQKFKI